MNKQAYLTTLPDFVEIQRASFCWFLLKGLSEELAKFSSITDLSNNIELNFFGQEYKLRKPKYGILEAKRRDSTYAVKIYVPMSITFSSEELAYSTDKNTQTQAFIGELPLMTDRGTFIINGCERVVINQIIRSPGIYYKEDFLKTGQTLHSATLIPNRGSWLKFEIDKKKALTISIDKTEKIKAELFFSTLNLTNQEILGNFTYPGFLNLIPEESENTEIQDLKTLRNIKEESLEIKELFDNKIFNPKYYEIGNVGRYKLNDRLNLNIPQHVGNLTIQDIFAIIDLLISFEYQEQKNR